MAARIVKEELTAEYLRELLSYDQDTGVFVWRVSCQGTNAGDVAGTPGSEGRRKITIGYRSFKSHRLAWLYVYGCWPKQLIDHINGDPTDNRICNLREATVSENQGNQRVAHTRNQTGLLGAHKKNGRNNFRARITVAGKQIHLGHFPTADLAHAAYLAAKATYHPLGDVAKGADPAPDKSKRSDTSNSGIQGVGLSKRAKSADKWIARINVGGVQKHLGTYSTKEEAALVYQAFKTSSK